MTESPGDGHDYGTVAAIVGLLAAFAAVVVVTLAYRFDLISSLKTAVVTVVIATHAAAAVGAGVVLLYAEVFVEDVSVALKRGGSR